MVMRDRLLPGARCRDDVNDRPGRFVTRYLDSEFWRSSNPDGVRGRAGSYHRPLCVYLNSLLAAGFQLDAVVEPRATRLLVDQQPIYRDLPVFFAARAIAV
jgi:hypothetical protein